MDISEILSSLSEDDINQLKAAASSILGNDAGKREAESGSKTGFSADLLNNIGKISNAFSRDDEKTELVKALKPLLSPDRQQKADEVIKILRIIQIIPVLKESGLLNGIL